MNAFWRFCSSVRCTLWLVGTVIVVSFVGTLLPEKMQPLVYYSWWFLALLAAFSFNCLACVLKRIAFQRAHIGSIITHLSVLVILAGALASFLWTERGVVELAEGQETDAFTIGSRQQPLGFSLRLEDFDIQWYGSGPLEYDIRVIVGDSLKRKYLLKEQQEQGVEDSGYAVSVLEYMPDFALDEQNLPFNRSVDPNNPAVRLRVRTPHGEETRWAFANHPDIGMGDNDPHIRIFFVWEPMIKEFASTVRFSGTQQERVFKVKVNHPAVFGGYTFYQSGYDAENPDWTSLEVARDPGAGIVFAGFFLLNAGLIMVFFPKIKRSLC